MGHSVDPAVLLATLLPREVMQGAELCPACSAWCSGLAQRGAPLLPSRLSRRWETHRSCGIIELSVQISPQNLK